MGDGSTRRTWYEDASDNDFNKVNCQTPPKCPIERKGIFPGVSNGQGPPICDEKSRTGENLGRPEQSGSTGLIAQPDQRCNKVQPVYFIQSEETCAIKIGTSANPLDRLADLQTAHDSKLHLLGTTTKYAEAALHKRFRRFRKRGEWFSPEPPLLIFLAKIGIPARETVDELLTRIADGVAALTKSAVPKASFSVLEFCRRHNFSESTYRRLEHSGRAPRAADGRISREVEAEWIREREREAEEMAPLKAEKKAARKAVAADAGEDAR
jgi:hypothetical protein